MEEGKNGRPVREVEVTCCNCTTCLGLEVAILDGDVSFLSSFRLLM